MGLRVKSNVWASLAERSSEVIFASCVIGANPHPNPLFLFSFLFSALMLSVVFIFLVVASVVCVAFLQLLFIVTSM